MLKRKIWSKLEDFKANANKKTLLLTGARQVGKTYIVDYAKCQSAANTGRHKTTAA